MIAISPFGAFLITLNYMNIVSYIKETKVELSHVSWATRAQAIQYTALVILISLAISAYLGLFDSIFSFILKLVI